MDIERVRERGRETSDQSTGFKTDTDKNAAGGRQADQCSVVLSVDLTGQE